MFTKWMFVVVTMGVLATGAARADEVQNTPGSLCVATGTGDLSALSTGQAENKTSSTVTAICPVDRKYTSSGFTTHMSAKVWVLDQHSTSNVCCRTVSQDVSGRTTYGTEVCTTGASSSYQTLNLAQVDDSYTFPHFFVRCSVPPITTDSKTSRILTYRSTQW